MRPVPVVVPQPLPQKKRGKQEKNRERLTERPAEDSLFKTRFQWVFERLEDKHPGDAQNTVGKRYGLDSGQATRFQDGTSRPSLNVLKKFCQRSRANPTYLLLGEGDDFL